PSFFTRQQLFELLRCDGEGFSFVCTWVTTSTQPHRFPSSFRAAFPVARKRRDSMHPPLAMQPLCENILKKPRTLPRAGLQVDTSDTPDCDRSAARRAAVARISGS
ncbi:hypothetical protein, partial [Burkholderia vietnamiensis]